MDIPLLGRCWMLAMVSPVTPIIGACLFRTDSDLFCLYIRRYASIKAILQYRIYGCMSFLSG